MLRGVLLVLALCAGGVFAVRYVSDRYPQHLPWTPLKLTQPVGYFTPLKFAQMRNDFATCRRLLTEAGVSYSILAPVRAGPLCGYTDGITRTDEGDIRYSPSAAASCVVVAGLHMWEREVVQPAARRHFGQPISGVRTFGTYACRRIGGGSRGSYSQHAHANAIDIAAFTLENGEDVSIAADWHGGGAKAAFLREVRDGACGIFGTTLSPDYNAAHRDHLHIDQTPRSASTVCR
jgi:hypothetical protein